MMTPPRLARWLASWRVPAEMREFALGDLEEEFVEIARRRGRRAARCWYWRQAIRAAMTPSAGPEDPASIWTATLPDMFPKPRSRPMTSLLRDIRFALRLLRRAPGFTAAVTLTLALGIGATTAIFSVVNAVLLTPPPFADPAGLVIARGGPGGENATPTSYPELREWRDDFKVFQDLGGYFTWGPTISGSGPADRLAGVRTTASLLSILGVQPALGRLFAPAEELIGSGRVVLVSHAYWRNRLGANPRVLDTQLRLNDQPFTVIGVLPAWFQRLRPGDGAIDVLAPLRLTDETAPRSLNFIRVVARLKPGQTPAQAEDQLRAAVRRAQPDAQPAPDVNVTPMRQLLVSDSRATLLALLGAVGFLLLITCANLANLLLARATGRRQEIAVRLALGAGRWRIGTQLLTESVVLAGAGGVGGVALAWLGVRALAGSPVIAEAGAYTLAVNLPVLAFAAAVSIAAGLVFGLAPAVRAVFSPANADLRDSTRSTTGRSRLPGLLIAVEVALTLMLLVGAGLLIRSFVNLLGVDTGFQGDRVLTFNLSTPSTKYPTGADHVRFFTTAAEKLAALPGVEAVGLVNELPLGGSGVNGGVRVEGRTFPPGQAPQPEKRIVSPDYFRAFGIRTRHGRTFTPADTLSAPKVIVVSEHFASRVFPNESPIGKKVSFDWDLDGFLEVIGVVSDVKHYGLDDEPQSMVYVSHLQRSNDFMTVVVRTSGDPLSLVAPARAAIASIDPDRPLMVVRTMDMVVSESVAARRLSLWLVGGFAALGLVLAATGIYGVVSYAARQRTREVGIRLALGASHTNVLGLVLGHGLWMTLAGLAAGTAGSYALTGLVRSQLFGIEPTDAGTFASVIAGLAVIAALAAYVPARRAARVDPARVLRTD